MTTRASLRPRAAGTLFAALLALRAPLAAQAPGDSTHAVALVGVTLIDGTGAAARADQTVVVEGERISAIFPRGSRPLPPGAEVLELAGRYLIPGLIDTHVHVATDPSVEDTRERSERRLRKALYGGVTTVRDMAGDVRSLAYLQREARLGEIASPDLYFVALFAGPAFFADPRTHDATRGLVAGEVPWMRGISDTTDLRQAVAEARGTGATALKLYAALSGELAGRITAEAHRQGLRVWAHAALRPARPLEVVEAGVDVVSHASLVAYALDSATRATALKARPGERVRLDSPGLDSVLQAMRQHHTVLEPTLLIYEDNAPLQRLSALITRRAHDAGIPMIAGTDTLGGADTDDLELPNIHRELELLVRLGGLSPAEALAAATRTAAEILGAGDERGTIAVGKLADLVVLTGNPLRNISNTRTVELVVKRGAVYRR